VVLKVNAGDVRRSDLFHVDPTAIVVNDELRGREFVPTEATIIALAVSLLTQGQLQPVQCRRIEDNRLQLVLGFTRTAAARLIRDGFTDSDGVFHQDESFALQVKIVDGNDEESLIRNIVENAIRNETSAIDDAHNQNRLRERYGKSDVEIAKIYGYPSSVKVGRLRKLLGLEKPLQVLVHEGLAVQAALDLLELPAEKRAEFIAEAEKGGPINGATVRAQVRDHHLNDDGKEDDGAGAGAVVAEPVKAAKPLSIKEIRTFLTGQIEGDKQPDAVKAFYTVLLAFVNGKKSDRSLINGMKKLVQTTIDNALEVNLDDDPGQVEAEAA
jgi:ParB-like chromosome segregation protein Spo0J